MSNRLKVPFLWIGACSIFIWISDKKASFVFFNLF